MECAAIQECLEACHVLRSDRYSQGKALLIRMTKITEYNFMNFDRSSADYLYC